MDNEKNKENVESSSEGSSRPVCACQSRAGMWFMVIALIVVGAAIVWSRFSSSESETAVGGSGVSIQWATDYQAGLKLASEQSKPVLLVFTASWCPPCQDMKKHVFTEAVVVKAAEPFVSIMIDTDEQTSLSEQYNVAGIPAYFILKPDGTIVETFVGSMPAEEFAAKLGEGLKKAS